jgi:hypothetical protein
MPFLIETNRASFKIWVQWTTGKCWQQTTRTLDKCWKNSKISFYQHITVVLFLNTESNARHMYKSLPRWSRSKYGPLPKNRRLLKDKEIWSNN